MPCRKFACPRCKQSSGVKIIYGASDVFRGHGGGALHALLHVPVSALGGTRTCASGLVNSGASLFLVAEVLGHKNVSSSQRYSHLANDTLLAAVDAGAAQLGNTSQA